MADKIKLVDRELDLCNELRVLIVEARNSIKKNLPWGHIQEERYATMSQKAHELHMKLKDRGLEPKHHRYMYDNRRVPVDDVEFYNHIHPVEDLIKFIDDPDANNDPEDTTIGKEFKFNIYTRRWGHYDYYKVTRRINGWELSFNDTTKCDKKCTYLLDALNNDFVSYPYNIGDFFEWIWNEASEGLSMNEVQQAIDDVAEWISTCEKTVPRGIFKEMI